MSKLSIQNQMRRMAGLPVDYVAEAAKDRAEKEALAITESKKSIITEARTVPGRKSEVAKKTPENMRDAVEQAEKALDHVEEAIKCLERIPALDFDGVVPHMINELEDVLTDDDDGVSLTSCVNKIQTTYRKWRRTENATDKVEADIDDTVKAHEEEEEFQRRACDMKNILHIGHDASPKMTKKGSTIQGWVSDLASDGEEEVTIEFDYKPAQEEEEESAGCEIFAVSTEDGRDIDPDTLEKDDVEKEILAAIQSSEGLNEGKAEKDYDGDGEIESDEEEYKGSREKAAKKAKKDEVKEDHFKVGQVVTDAKTDKKYEIVSIDNEGEGKKEVYKTKCKKSGKKKDFSPKQLKESMHFYNTSNYSDWEDDVSDPVNVADGSSNGDKVWDVPANPENDRDESPHQLADPMSAGTSPQDQSVGDEAPLKVPANIKKALQDEINQARAEAEKLDVYNKDAKVFYHDLANAFEDLLNHLKGETVGDIKKAQIYMTSLMGPMLHKVPATVVNFIARGGKNRSLKDYYKPVDSKYPITGPRDVLS